MAGERNGMFSAQVQVETILHRERYEVGIQSDVSSFQLQWQRLEEVLVLRVYHAQGELQWLTQDYTLCVVVAAIELESQPIYSDGKGGARIPLKLLNQWDVAGAYLEFRITLPASQRAYYYA